jgi:hypothetical protein
MGMMKNLVIDIQESIELGDDFDEIADRFNVSLADVEAIADAMDSSYDESMDGDHDSAMASAGFGTDEDYGYAGEDF